MIKNILIVGGGTAGWITALSMKTYFPHLKVELIESEEIGVLGAGESTTGLFGAALDELKIDVADFIKNTESTIKTGIRFDNWKHQGSLYLSNFSPWLNHDIISIYDVPEYLLYCYVNNIDVRQIGLNKLYLNNKLPWIGDINNKFTITCKNKLGEVGEKRGGTTLHINAKLTAKYIRRVAESRGVIRHEGKVIKINGHYPIKSIEDDKGNTHIADFFFDCSGFARLIIGNHYKTKWIDYSNHFTVNSTIPFFLPLEETYPAYTHAIAMKYGWMFRVPTQKRFGSGYIYNSNLISKEQAIQEVEEKLGRKIELVNFFKFQAGTFEKTKVSNCISLGLSSGFFEPMAATNLNIVFVMLRHLKTLSNINALIYSSQDEIFYNEIYLKSLESSDVTEIFSHYVGARNDTEFWQHYKNIENYPTLFRKAYEQCFMGDKFEFREFSRMTNFNLNTFITKLIGNDWFKEKAIKYYNKYNLENRFKQKHLEYNEYTDNILPYVLDQRKYLENL